MYGVDICFRVIVPQEALSTVNKFWRWTSLNWAMANVTEIISDDAVIEALRWQPCPVLLAG